METSYLKKILDHCYNGYFGDELKVKAGEAEEKGSYRDKKESAGPKL